MDERKFLIALAAHIPFGPVRIKLLLEYFGSAEKVWNASSKELRELGLSEKLVEGFINFKKKFDQKSYFATLEKFGIKVLIPGDKNFPERLAEISGAPTLIYTRGELLPSDSVSIAVVGSRKVTSYGREVTYKISSELASRGVVIISGLALGVDGIAHQAALDVGSRTLAVLGNGLDSVYPPVHRELAKNIIKSGALISEYPLGYPALPINFPQRNRIVSGMSLGVLVIEGTEKSGTLLTASHAAEQGRDVFAVPGPITSPNAGAPNILLRNGAKLVTSAQDILDELEIGNKIRSVANREILPETAEESTILNLLERERLDIDTIVRTSGMAAGEVLATLTSMELKGIVRNAGGKYTKN